jgi:diadenosine tetraphosphate (Ap4A) HIT family hydrolase
MAECLACALAAGRTDLPGGRVHRTAHWLVEHCVGPLTLGTLVVKPERHVTKVADLSQGEAEELGPLLRLASWVAGRLTGADQVYNCLWSHGRGVPVHLHFVVQPVTRATVEAFDAHGPDLQVAMFAAGQPLDVHDVERVAAEARQLFALQ